MILFFSFFIALYPFLYLILPIWWNFYVRIWVLVFYRFFSILNLYEFKLFLLFQLIFIFLFELNIHEINFLQILSKAISEDVNYFISFAAHPITRYLISNRDRLNYVALFGA